MLALLYQAVEKLPALSLLIKERGVKNGLACEPRLGAPIKMLIYNT
jgi:hypothetical protein